ncbi:hypothetical protein GCM10008024_11650 [Allgaiera indica]|uniref:Uncharacterized protein n=1 Tax=Allgaiera indica TaxID=765699 RepID=A0AAN4UPW9_9RHOB|nr:hypothetical protein GCM10008024_11650 [Allgaiera indica]
MAAASGRTGRRFDAADPAEAKGCGSLGGVASPLRARCAGLGPRPKLAPGKKARIASFPLAAGCAERHKAGTGSVAQAARPTSPEMDKMSQFRPSCGCGMDRMSRSPPFQPHHLDRKSIYRIENKQKNI